MGRRGAGRNRTRPDSDQGPAYANPDFRTHLLAGISWAARLEQSAV
ncbi:ThuA domain-containing protein [Streptomyces canus]|nr:hypothetical protein [Streptomyces canus]MCX5252901.1 ThuA domain-containing protein [Streptomyces canus]